MERTNFKFGHEVPSRAYKPTKPHFKIHFQVKFLGVNLKCKRIMFAGESLPFYL